MCGSEVERKKRQQEFNSTRMISYLSCAYVTYLPTVWQRQRMCGSKVERKKRQQQIISVHNLVT